MTPILVLQHIACEPPAAYEDELVARGAAIHRVELDRGDPLPDWRDFAAVVIMGGPMGAYDTEPEIGLLPVRLTDEGLRDPVFAAAGRPALRSLQWHSDSFELPAGAVRLAGSPAYRNQAFRWRNAYGLQFHLEVPLTLAEDWAEVPAYRQALEEQLGAGALAALLDDLARHEAEMTETARRLVGAWHNTLVAAPAP